MSAAPISGAGGRVVAGVVVFQDISDRVRGERLLASQRDVMAMIARGEPLAEMLAEIVAAYERLSDRGGRGTITIPRPDALEDQYGAPFGRDGADASWATQIRATDGAVAGTLALHHAQPAEPLPEEHEVVELLSRTAAVAIERDRDVRTRERQLSAAGQPAPAAVTPDHRGGGGRDVPPGDRTLDVGGDFYDVFPLPDGGWGLVIGDVCGHGAQAAAMTALTRHTTRAIAGLEPDPRSVLLQVSEALLGSGHNRYCTAVYGRLDRAGRAWRFALAVGGTRPR